MGITVSNVKLDDSVLSGRSSGDVLERFIDQCSEESYYSISVSEAESWLKRVESTLDEDDKETFQEAIEAAKQNGSEYIEFVVSW